MIINAEKLILGRMAAIVAKQALLGQEIKIVNCEKAVIIGHRRPVVAHYKKKLKLGQPQQGPFIQRRPDFFVRRTIRGMLPRKKDRGREAYSRIKCYVGIPQELEGKETTLKEAENTRHKKDVTSIAELCLQLGDKAR